MEATTAQCAKHHFDRAVAQCGHCALTFCPSCLVYAFGPNKPPFCIPCALTVGGVRRMAAAAPKVSWRERRAQKKLLAAQEAAVAEANLRGALASANADARTEGSATATPSHDASGGARGAEPPEEMDWSAPFDTAFAD